MEINNHIIKKAMENSTVAQLMDSLKTFDEYTYQHSLSVANVSVSLGKKLHLSSQELKELSYAALTHDIGKICIGKNLIKKPDPLTDAELKIIYLHPLYGANILNTYSMFSINVKSGVLMHHENYDGTGYLTKTYGAAIPLFARILRITDSYAVMKSGRPYQKAMTEEEIRKELQRESGKSYDPKILKLF